MVSRALRELSTHVQSTSNIAKSRLLAVASAGIGLASLSTRVSAQADPTPTPQTGQIVAPPTATSPRSTIPSPTPTSGSFAQPPTATPTPEQERETDEPSPTPASQPTETPTQPSLVEPDPEGDDEQTIPCPYPYSPFNWFCLPGAGGRWFPVIPPREFTELTGVSAYVIRGTPFADIEEGRSWTFEAIARNADGVAVGNWRHEVAADVHVGRFWSAEIDLTVQVALPDQPDTQLVLNGMLNGDPFEVVPHTIRSTREAGTEPRSLPGAALLHLFQPLIDELDGLLDLAPADGGVLEIGCLNAILKAIGYCLAFYFDPQLNPVAGIVCDQAFNDAFGSCW
jgi:hypothetical protein